MSALFFGSISTLADTSELQRRAFNEAFSAHGLDWNWDREDYQSMLGSNGGKQRVADYAAGRGEDVDAEAVHATKSKTFQKLLIDEGVSPRAGVADTIARVKADGHRLALVTTTSAANVKALLAALDLGGDVFDLVVDNSSVQQSKPDPAAYRYALEKLGEDAARVIAIEDNEGGVKAAAAAGVRCIAFPNENTVHGDFSAADEKVDSLDAGHIAGLIQA